MYVYEHEQEYEQEQEYVLHTIKLSQKQLPRNVTSVNLKLKK